MRILLKFICKLTGGDEITSNMKKNSIWMLIIKGLSLLISLAYVPMILNAVEKNDYGVFLTLTSLVHWVAMLDIGLGNGLRNKIPGFIVSGRADKAKEAVSSCYVVLAFYISILVILFVMISPFLSLQSILNAPDNDESELLYLSIVVFVSFGIQFVANLVTSVLYAFQLPAATSVLSLISQIVVFVAAWIMINIFGISSIFQIGSITCLVPPLVIIIGSIYLYNTKLKIVRPAFKCVRLSSVQPIISLGIKFFALQIITIVLFQANSIIIAHAVGPSAVVEYNIAYKLISLATIIYTIIVSPVWSATTVAFEKGDMQWINNTASYLRKVFYAIFILGVIVVAFSGMIYKVWLGSDTITISYSTTILIFIFVSFDMLYKIYGTIINGIGKIHAQMVITAIVAVIYIPIAYLSGKALGLNGVLIANCITFAINYLWSKIQYRKIMGGSTSKFWSR